MSIEEYTYAELPRNSYLHLSSFIGFQQVLIIKPVGGGHPYHCGEVVRGSPRLRCHLHNWLLSTMHRASWSGVMVVGLRQKRGILSSLVDFIPKSRSSLFPLSFVLPTSSLDLHLDVCSSFTPLFPPISADRQGRAQKRGAVCGVAVFPACPALGRAVSPHKTCTWTLVSGWLILTQQMRLVTTYHVPFAFYLPFVLFLLFSVALKHPSGNFGF